ncbi:hypothetical protein D3C71_1358630 [compost metagenome]
MHIHHGDGRLRHAADLKALCPQITALNSSPDQSDIRTDRFGERFFRAPDGNLGGRFRYGTGLASAHLSSNPPVQPVDNNDCTARQKRVIQTVPIFNFYLLGHTDCLLLGKRQKKPCYRHSIAGLCAAVKRRQMTDEAVCQRLVHNPIDVDGAYLQVCSGKLNRADGQVGTAAQILPDPVHIFLKRGGERGVLCPGACGRS